MISELIFILVVFSIIALWLLLRTNKRVRELKSALPNFISFCQKENMELVMESSNSIMYRKRIDLQDYEDAYLDQYGKELKPLVQIELYHYVSMLCEGDFNPINLNSNKPNEDSTFRMLNTIELANVKPNPYSGSELYNWNDSVDFYEDELKSRYLLTKFLKSIHRVVEDVNHQAEKHSERQLIIKASILNLKSWGYPNITEYDLFHHPDCRTKFEANLEAFSGESPLIDEVINDLRKELEMTNEQG